jgi:hypothetical protein
LIVFHFIFLPESAPNTLRVFFMLFLRHDRHYMTAAQGGGVRVLREPVLPGRAANGRGPKTATATADSKSIKNADTTAEKG